MQCHNCQVKNLPDAVYCRICGEELRKCAVCAVGCEQDARYCRRCGRTVEPSEEEDDDEKTLQQATAAARRSRPPGDVDFTTKASARRVVQIRSPEPHPPRRAERTFLYVAASLALAAAVAVALTFWINSGPLPYATAGEGEELRADLEEFKRSVAETREDDRRAVLEEISVVLFKSLEETRRAADETIKRRVAEVRDEYRKTLGSEVAKAVAKAREHDLTRVTAELARLRDKYKDRRLGRDIERVISLIDAGGAGHVQRRGQADARRKPEPRQEQARGLRKGSGRGHHGVATE